MRKTAILMILLVVVLVFATGCAQKYAEKAENVTQAIKNETKQVKKPVDIVEKRGYKTNITDFNELVLRASTIKSYKYNLSDTKYPQGEKFIFLGRFVRVTLPGLRQHNTGAKYDEVFLDRITKTAFSHCSIRYCPKPNVDKEIDLVNYSDYYINDPMEYLYEASKANYTGEDMIGDQYTKVFDIMFEGRPGKIWLQEYYGYPIKIEVNGTKKRHIEFKDMMVDATRSGELDLPFNFTVSGKQGSWYFWEHYLGEWPKPGQNVEEAYAELLNQTNPKGAQPKLVLAT